MKREFRRTRPTLILLLVVTLSAPAVTAYAGQAQSTADPVQTVARGIVTSAPMGPAPARSADLPYAVLADSLLSDLVRRSEYPGLLEAWAEERGLDPESAFVQELLDGAQAVAQRYPWRLTQEARGDLLRRYAGDDEGLRHWRQHEKTLRYRAVGAAWGRWLEARKAEGHPPAVLVERLLDVDGSTVLLASGDPHTELDRQREVRAFVQGLRSVMETVPERLAW